MVESWIIGLIAVAAATPIAIASYVSAVRWSRQDERATEHAAPAPIVRHARAARRVADGQHRQNHRRIAA